MRKPHLSTGAWIFASVAFATLAIPTGVYAATTASNERVQDGSSSTLATVDTANQLLTAETSPSNDVVASGGGSGCATIYNVPSNKALIIKSVDFYLLDAGASGRVEGDLFGTGCNTFLAAGIAPQGSNLTQNQTFGAGIAVPAGSVISVETFNDEGTVEIYGYLVPKGAVPANALADVSRVKSLQGAGRGATTR